MTPSDLTRHLVLEAPERVPDGLGGHGRAWAVLGSHWASIRPSRGRHQSRGDVAVSGVPAEIIVRGAPVGAVSRPEPGQRFREGPRIWRVVAVTEADAAGRYLRCDAVEETAA
ncbi:head-tail adaptor protein [Mangrovicoccus sp. HB161399]|uniref:head-tail adaptor protein n=1 Tax=Mangrovicoccus sp. HB161399 TaxID=2720392 RepID=UPI0015553A03|nr:head-tail adaptor protein [Mangrovicoccus sp. HB161399]